MENLEHITQQSDEWHRWRAKGIGSSEIAVIMGRSPYKSEYRLWAEKTGLVEPEDLSLNFVVQRGNALEPEARELANEILKKEFKPRLFMSSQHDWARYSSDGACGDEIIEIKCPLDKTHNLAVIDRGIPEHYLMQIQYGLMVSGAKKCYYVSYSPDHADKIAIIPVGPDEKLHAEMIEACEKFWHNVQSGEPPALTNKDKVDCQDLRMKNLVERYRNAKMKQIIVDQELEGIEGEMKELANMFKYLNVTCDGVSMVKINKKGTVDYSKIEALKGINLDDYRRPPSIYWTIKLKKESNNE